jgi:4-aminobutyrate aminotransferase
VAAIKKQLDELCFAPRRFTCEPAVELAEKLAALAPGDLGKVLFTTGGSDAIEVALKIARAATGRFKTVSFWDAFHGAGFGAASVGGEATFRSHIAGPMMTGTEHVAPWDGYRCPYGHDSLEASGLACANMIAYVLGREQDVAAVVAEPMRATPNPPPPGFWKQVREACDRHGTLLIFDEIPTGLGKTGKFFAHEHDGVTPDIVVLGKSLGGGILPIAAVIARRDLDVTGGFAIGHYTHEKNPVTTRAALTTIDIIQEEGLVERSAELGRHMLGRMQDLMARSPHVGDVRGRGLMVGVELVENRASRQPARELAERVFYACLEQGLSFKISQGNVLTLSPPMVIARADLERALGIVERAILEG